MPSVGSKKKDKPKDVPQVRSSFIHFTSYQSSFSLTGVSFRFTIFMKVQNPQMSHEKKQDNLTVLWVPEKTAQLLSLPSDQRSATFIMWESLNRSPTSSILPDFPTVNVFPHNRNTRIPRNVTDSKWMKDGETFLCSADADASCTLQCGSSSLQFQWA